MKVAIGLGLLALRAPLLAAELTVVGGAPGDKHVFRMASTSQFKFYGKLSGEQAINASAVVLKGRDLCWPKADVVKGKIVIAVRENTLCDLEVSYEALDAYGALALVSIVAQRRPGFFCYRHLSWDRYALADNALVLVEATKKGFVVAQGRHVGNFGSNGIEKQFARILDDWTARADEGTLRLLLSAPWDTFYQDYYESWWRKLFMQVLLPCYALYSSALAVLHSLRYYRKGTEWAPGRVICFMEAPIMLLIAVVLACGLYGPDTLPTYTYVATVFLGSTFGHTTSIIVVLFVRHSMLDLQRGVKRSNVCKVHRRKLLAFLVVGVLSDVTLPRMSFYLGNTRLFDTIVVIFAVVYFLMQVAIGIVYTQQTANYVIPLQKYVRHPDSNPRTEHVAAVRSLVFYLRFSIFAMVIQTISMILMFLIIRPRANLRRKDFSSLGQVAVAIFAWSRITVSYCQINSIAPPLDLAPVFGFLVGCCAKPDRPVTPASRTVQIPTQWDLAAYDRPADRLESQEDLVRLASIIHNGSHDAVALATIEIKSPNTHDSSGECCVGSSSKDSHGNSGSSSRKKKAYATAGAAAYSSSESDEDMKTEASDEWCEEEINNKGATKARNMAGDGSKRPSRSATRTNFSSLSSTSSRSSLPSIDERMDDEDENVSI